MTWKSATEMSKMTPPDPKEVQEVELYAARKAKPRFYADENFPKQAGAILRKLGARVTTAQEVGRKRHPDENHAAFALKNGLVLVTCDRDYLNNRRFPLIHCPAIFVFDFGGGTVREMRQAFRCLFPVFCAPQFYDKWWKIDASPDSWTESARFLDGSSSRTRYRFSHGVLQEWVADGN